MDFLSFLAQYRSPLGDVLFQSATWIAQETLVVIIICWLYWCYSKKLAYTLGFTYFLSGLFVQGLKITFRIPRPWVLDPDFQAVESALPGATGYSFPSGHTQSGTALFSTLAFKTSRRFLKILCCFFIIFIGFSRMYLGVHTPKDVLVSAALTLLISAGVFHLLAPYLDDGRHTGKITFILIFLCVLLFGYTGILYVSDIADPVMALDAFKACGAGLGFAVGYYLEKKYIHFTMPDTLREKLIRFSVGFITVGALMAVFQLTLKKFLAGEILSYFLLILWIVAIYPALFSRHASRPRPPEGFC